MIQQQIRNSNQNLPEAVKKQIGVNRQGNRVMTVSAVGNNTSNNNGVAKKVYLPEMSSIYYYIIANAENDKETRDNVLGYLREQGFKTPNVIEAPFYLAKAVEQRGKQGLYDLAKIHPDRQVIINQYLIEKGLVKESDVANACGCCSADGSNCDDSFNKADDTNVSDTKMSTANKLIWGGIIISVVGIVALLTTDKK